MNSEHPEFNDKYYDKYKEARTHAGLKETTEDSENNFMKYLVEDAVLPGIDDIVEGGDDNDDIVIVEGGDDDDDDEIETKQD